MSCVIISVTLHLYIGKIKFLLINDAFHPETFTRALEGNTQHLSTYKIFCMRFYQILHSRVTKIEHQFKSLTFSIKNMT